VAAPAPGILPAAAVDTPPAGDGKAVTDPNVTPAGCSACEGGLLSNPDTAPGAAGCAGPSCGGCCYPGRLHCCSPCCADSCVGRMLCGLYECICCPDPCYEPHWVAAANAAFFVDAARPVTQLALKYDGMYDVQHPDRAEYLIPRSGASMNTAPAAPNPLANCIKTGTGKGLKCISNTADIEELKLYTEGAIERIGIFVETPYREYGPEGSTNFNGAACCNQSGFSDLTVGTKTLLLDCELLQIAFQFKTIIPVGNFLQNLGTGHVSLEPALLFALKLTPDTYLQGELAYWIPIGGDALYEGNIWHNHFSLNTILWRILPDVQVIGTWEANEWSVFQGNYSVGPILDAQGNQVTMQNGLFTNAVFTSATTTIFSTGPGVRLNICDRIDFGVGTAFSLTGQRWAQEQVRAEFRWRF
jgi:hypothetical protein